MHIVAPIVISRMVAAFVQTGEGYSARQNDLSSNCTVVTVMEKKGSGSVRLVSVVVLHTVHIPRVGVHDRNDDGAQHLRRKQHKESAKD